MITRKTLEDALGIGSKAALRLIKTLPGARQATLPGGAVQWVVDDDSVLENITEDMIAEARAAVQIPGGGGSIGAAPSVARAVAEDPEVLGDRKRLERERLEVERLKAETDRIRQEGELRRLRGNGRDRDGLDPLLVKLLDRLDQRPDPGAQPLRQEIAELRRKLEQAGTPRTAEVIAEVTKALTPLLIPFVNRLAAPATPQAPPFGIQDLIGALKGLKDLGGAASDFAQIKEVFSQGVELGVIKSEAVAEGGAPAGESSWWAPLVEAGTRFLNNVAAHPASAQIALGLLQKLAAAEAGVIPPTSAPTLSPMPSGAPASAPTPAAPPAGPVGAVPTATSTPSPSAAPSDASAPAGAHAATDPIVVHLLEALREIGRATTDDERRAQCESLSAVLWSMAGEANLPMQALMESLPAMNAAAVAARFSVIHPGFMAAELRPGIEAFLAFEREQAKAEAAGGE